MNERDLHLINLAQEMLMILNYSNGDSKYGLQTLQKPDKNESESRIKLLSALFDPRVYGDDREKIKGLVKREAEDVVLSTKLWANDSSEDNHKGDWMHECINTFGETVRDILNGVNPLQRAEASKAQGIEHYGERGTRFMILAKQMIVDPSFLSSQNELAEALRGIKQMSERAKKFGRLVDLGVVLLNSAKRWSNETNDERANALAQKNWEKALLAFSQSVESVLCSRKQEYHQNLEAEETQCFFER